MAVVGNEILFTKVAGNGQLVSSSDKRCASETVSTVGVGSRHKPGSVRLQLSHEAVDSIQSNVERYKEFLQKRSHHTDSRFNPWTAVEQ